MKRLISTLLLSKVLRSSSDARERPPPLSHREPLLRDDAAAVTALRFLLRPGSVGPLRDHRADEFFSGAMKIFNFAAGPSQERRYARPAVCTHCATRPHPARPAPNSHAPCRPPPSLTPPGSTRSSPPVGRTPSTLPGGLPWPVYGSQVARSCRPSAPMRCDGATERPPRGCMPARGDICVARGERSMACALDRTPCMPVCNCKNSAM